MKHTHLVKTTILLFINKFSSALAAFVLLPIYTSHFSARDFGLMDLITGYITLIAMVLSIRIDMGIFKHLVDARGDNTSTVRIISSSIGVLSLISLAGLLIGFGLGLFVEIPFYSLIVLAIFSNIIFGTMSQITRGIGLTRSFVIISITSTAISFLVSLIGVLIFKMGVEVILISIIVSQLLGSALMAIPTKVHKLVKRKQSSRTIQKQLLAYSSPLVIDGASFWIMNTSGRTILVVAVGTAANGLYAVASKFAMIIEQAVGVFFQAFIETATLYAKKPNRSELYSDVMNKYLKLLWSGCILLIALIPFIFPLLIRDIEFSDALLLIPVMIVAVMVRAVQNFIAAIYQANGHTKQIANTTIIGAIVNLVVTILLVPFIGVWAVAISLTVSYLILTMYRYFNIRKYDINLRINIKILLTFIGIVAIVLTLYYINNPVVNVVNLALAAIFTATINWHTVKTTLKNLLKRP